MPEEEWEIIVRKIREQDAREDVTATINSVEFRDALEALFNSVSEVIDGLQGRTPIDNWDVKAVELESYLLDVQQRLKPSGEADE